MRIKIFIPVLLILILAPFAARAIDQETIDQFIFLLQQPEDGGWWRDGVFDDDTLYEGLEAVYAQALSEENDGLLRQTVWAMGETGLAVFAPTIIETLPDELITACYALGKIPSEDGVYALVGVLDDEDMHVRDAAAWGLGNLPYSSGFEEARDEALAALNDRLEAEEEDWVLETVEAAIVMIETGVATIEAFEEPLEPV